MWNRAPMSPETSDQFFRVMSGSRDLDFWAQISGAMLSAMLYLMKNHFGYIKITLPTCFLAAHERRYHYLTRFGAILVFLVPVAVVRGVERLMNYGIRIDTTLFPLNFLDQMG